MGTILRLILMKFLPARIAWVVGAFILARALASRRARSAEPPTVRTVKYW